MGNAILDWAARRGSWWPAVAGLLVAFIAYALDHPGAAWAWALFAAGLAMTAIRPLGTGQRRRILIRQARRLLDDRRATP
jgi:O-antigen/teichoic acid export membrane protein